WAVGGGILEFEGSAMFLGASALSRTRQRLRLAVEHAVLGEAHQHVTGDFGGAEAEGLVAVVAIAQKEETAHHPRDALLQLGNHDLALSGAALDATVVEHIDPATRFGR